MQAVTVEFAPATGTEEEWNEAYARLADYFRSFHLHNRIRRTQLILETLTVAAENHAKDLSKAPTQHTIEQARRVMRTWLGEVYDGMDMNEAEIEAAGRIGFFMSGGPDRWPHHFMNRETLPEEMAGAMRSAVRESGPSMQASKMTPRQIDLGLISEVAEDGIDKIGRHPLVRYAGLAILIGVVLGYLYTLLK